MNAAFHGRPVMIHERDIGWDMQVCFESQQPCFRLLLEVTNLLAKLISLYRPQHIPENAVFDIEFPSFEELVMKSGGSNVATSQLGTFITIFRGCAELASGN